MSVSHRSAAICFASLDLRHLGPMRGDCGSMSGNLHGPPLVLTVFGGRRLLALWILRGGVGGDLGRCGFCRVGPSWALRLLPNYGPYRTAAELEAPRDLPPGHLGQMQLINGATYLGGDHRYRASRWKCVSSRDKAKRDGSGEPIRLAGRGQVAPAAERKGRIQVSDRELRIPACRASHSNGKATRLGRPRQRKRWLCDVLHRNAPARRRVMSVR